MKILLYSIFSPPELTGIGKYNGEMIRWLGNKGHQIDLVTTFPFYPDWEVMDKYKGNFFLTESFGKNVTIYRSWAFIPQKVTGIKRMLHELSFLGTSFFYLFRNLFKKKYDVVICIAPPFHLAIPILLLRKSKRYITSYHIQDLQIDAAKELKLFPSLILSILEIIEKKIISKSDLVSTIGREMIKKIRSSKNIDIPITYFPNWTNLKQIRPNLEESYWLHSYLNISTSKKLIVYSGNIGDKQGLELLIPVAKSMQQNDQVHFVILGTGVFKSELNKLFVEEGLSNVTFGDLVPYEDLSKMLNSSFIQLVIQKEAAADSFLPSKLTNLLSAGCVSIVTANPGTGLYNIVNDHNCAVPVKAGSPNEIIENINMLLNDPVKRNILSINARIYAEKYLDKDVILHNYEKLLLDSLNKNQTVNRPENHV